MDKRGGAGRPTLADYLRLAAMQYELDKEEAQEAQEVEEAPKAEIPAPKLKKEKKSKKEKKNKPKAALSFGDDDTEESGEFKVKKSNRSRKLAEKLRNEVEKESKERLSKKFK